MLIDSHCHLQFFKDEEIDDLVKESDEQDVKYLLSAGTALKEIPKLFEISEKYKNVYISVGVHPEESGEDYILEDLILHAENPVVLGIGETGLDYHYKNIDREKQILNFRKQIRVALAVKKPLIIHVREAGSDVLKILKEERGYKVGGVMHCFTQSLEFAKEALDLGFFISISGIITFNNAEDLRETIKSIPLEYLLVETDAPYLAPVPFRGKINKPAYVTHTASYVSNLKKISS